MVLFKSSYRTKREETNLWLHDNLVVSIVENEVKPQEVDDCNYHEVLHDIAFAEMLQSPLGSDDQGLGVAWHQPQSVVHLLQHLLVHPSIPSMFGHGGRENHPKREKKIDIIRNQKEKKIAWISVGSEVILELTIRQSDEAE